MVILLVTYSKAGVILCRFCTILNNFLTSAESLAQTKLCIFWKYHPSTVEVLHLKEFRDMAHGENDDSFDRPTFMARENSLVLFTFE